MQVVIRADGGPDIGYGHLTRSGSIAATLADRGHSVTYATTTPEQVESVCPAEVDSVGLPTRGDPAPFVDSLRSDPPDVVVTDAYPVKTDYQRAIRRVAPLAVVEDRARHPIAADLLVNGNLYARSLDYRFVGPEPQTCLGTEFTILRQDIRERADQTPTACNTVERAIVTMGGSDTSRLTPTVLEAFDETELVVDAVVGPGFSPTQERAIESTAAAVSPEVRVCRNPDDLAERMYRADIAVCTASTTTYELLAVGTPMVSVPVAENQKPIATALRDRDAAVVLPPEPRVAEFRAALDRYLTDERLRETRQARGCRLVDGRGTERVCTELLSLPETNRGA